MSKGGIILKKQEMTNLWIDDAFIPVTLLKLIPQEIVRYKTLEKDGYLAAVVGAGKKQLNKEKGIKVIYDYMTEFSIDDEFMSKYNVGSVLDLSLVEGIESVTLRGISKGKGYQGVVRRHNFAGGPATHGSKFHRRPGSMGNRKPRRINKGHPLPGHMGLDQITLKNIKIVDIFKDDLGVIAVKGSVPGYYNSFLKLEM